MHFATNNCMIYKIKVYEKIISFAYGDFYVQIKISELVQIQLQFITISAVTELFLQLQR